MNYHKQSHVKINTHATEELVSYVNANTLSKIYINSTKYSCTEFV